MQRIYCCAGLVVTNAPQTYVSGIPLKWFEKTFSKMRNRQVKKFRVNSFYVQVLEQLTKNLNTKFSCDKNRIDQSMRSIFIDPDFITVNGYYLCQINMKKK